MTDQGRVPVRGSWIFVMGACSDVELEDLCDMLRERYDLPEFLFDDGDESVCARSGRWGMNFGVTRTDGPQVVEKGPAAGINYRIVLTMPWDAAGPRVMEEARGVIARALGADVALLSSRQTFGPAESAR